MKEIDLKNKVILITGATSGIGEEITKLLAKHGCKLALFARRTNKLKEISDELTNNDIKCIYKKCDVSNRENVKDAVEYVYKEYGRIDIAILNAGVLIANPIENFSSEPIRDSLEINFFGNMYFIEFLLPIMKSQKSGIIAVVSTLTDRRGRPGWSSYQSSKAALSVALESLRIDLIPLNIDVITIKPGSVKTPITDNQENPMAIESEKAAKIIVNGIKKRKKKIVFPMTEIISVKLVDMLPEKLYDKIFLD